MGKFIVVVALLIGGGIFYYLWNKEPGNRKDTSLDKYMDRTIAAEQKASAVLSADRLRSVQSAVDRYRVDHGSPPAALQDLVPQYLAHVPGGLEYDPVSGTVGAAP
jgi:type VI protein secretion system component VasK